MSFFDSSRAGRTAQSSSSRRSASGDEQPSVSQSGAGGDAAPTEGMWRRRYRMRRTSSFACRVARSTQILCQARSPLYSTGLGHPGGVVRFDNSVEAPAGGGKRRDVFDGGPAMRPVSNANCVDTNPAPPSSAPHRDYERLMSSVTASSPAMNCAQSA